MSQICAWCGEPGVGQEDVYHEKCAQLHLEHQLATPHPRPQTIEGNT